MATVSEAFKPKKSSWANRFDSPWFNPKLIIGVVFLVVIGFAGVIGGMFWDLTLARVASSPQDLPPAWMEGGTWDHPLGTENNGPDMLAVLLTEMSRLRTASWGEFWKMILAIITDNLGYHQWRQLAAVVGMFQYFLLRRRDLGARMERIAGGPAPA